MAAPYVPSCVALLYCSLQLPGPAVAVFRFIPETTAILTLFDEKKPAKKFGPLS